MGANNPFVSASLTAENTFTDALKAFQGMRVSISINGMSDSTVTFQRRLDGTNWRDVQDYAADAENTYQVDEQGDVRLGIKTGNYGTDTVVCRLGTGGGLT